MDKTEELVNALEDWIDGRDMNPTNLKKRRFKEILEALINEQIRLALEADKPKKPQ